MTEQKDKVSSSASVLGGGVKSKQSSPEQFLPPSDTTETTAAVFSSQKSQYTDYLTWKGFETKAGIQKHNTIKFLTKEFVDNCLDYLETRHNTGSVPPEIHVIIKRRKPSDNVIRIVFCNSNYDHTKPVFTKQNLKSIFDFNKYHSSKRNQHMITKGALGDALKEVVCVPHVLAHDNGITNWNYPLNISIPGAAAGQQKLFQVHLAIDRINQVIQPKITESTTSAATATEVHRYGNTEIELTLPVIDDDELLNERTYSMDIYNYLTRYAVFATHVKFIFEDQNIGGIRVEFPQIQPISPKWKNQSRACYYTRREFHDLILGLEDNDSTVYSVIYKTFVETSNMPKSELTQMTIGQLKHLPAAIDKLFDELRSSMSGPATLPLPFDTTKKVRKKAFEDRVEEMYGRFTESKYKPAFGSYSDGDETKIPFFFEIGIFHDVEALKDSQINLQFIQAINGSAIPTGYNIFSGGEFDWNTPGSKYLYSASSIREIFEHYGYSYDKDSRRCKKPHSLIVANLVCPKIEYESYGKSRINFRPFADLVAQTTVSVSMGGGRSSDGKPYKRDVLLQVLEERKYKWLAMDAAARVKHWWTQSDVFYTTRKLMIETYGYTNEEIDRDYITGIIREVCEDDGVKREVIGIIAADRAQLYFKGKWMDVGLKEIEELSLYGIDMLIIEKEGIAEQLALFADFNGIALLNTRGFLVEYASILSKKSEREGCNIAILTDFDASGLVLAAKAPNAYRIGIDFETLDDLGLNIEEVEESYKPGTHLNPLQGDGEYSDVYPSEWIDYVQGKRIEINSVVTTLDDNARFWEWIIDKLREHFVNRDYNRAIEVAKYKEPTPLDSFTDHLKQIGTSIVKDRREKVQTRLSNIGPGFLFDQTNKVLSEKGKPVISISEYEHRLTDHIRHIIESDKKLEPILQKIKQLDDELLLPLLEEDVDNEDEDEDET